MPGLIKTAWELITIKGSGIFENQRNNNKNTHLHTSSMVLSHMSCKITVRGACVECFSLNRQPRQDSQEARLGAGK